MSRRQLLGAGAVALALASVAWYWVEAPSRGSQVQPGAAEVALTATATGTGNWVRYLLAVQNFGDRPFTGDVLLIEADNQGTPLPADSLGASFVRHPTLPAPPQAAAQPAYRLHVTVPSGSTRTLTVIAPDAFNFAEVLSGSLVVGDAAVERAVLLPVAVLSDLESAAEAIGQVSFDRIAARASSFTSARTFPASAPLLAGYANIVITEFDSAALSAVQLRAVRDFVGLGGTLVVTGGSDWRRTLAPLPADLLPLTLRTTGTLPMAALPRLAGVAAPELEAPAAVGGLKPSAHAILTGPDGTPLAAELDYGSGRVVELAFDPGASPLAGSAYASLGWKLGLARSLLELPGSAPAPPTLLAPDPSFTALLPAAEDAPLPSVPLVGLVLLVYVALAGPLGYLLLRRWSGRQVLLWVTAPLTACLFTAIFYFVGAGLQGGLQDHELQVIKVGPGQTLNQLEYHRVLFLHRGNHEIEAGLDTLVAPMTLETFRTTGSTCERCTRQLQGLLAGSEQVLAGGQPAVREQGVVYGSVRVVASSGITHSRGGVEAHLQLHGGRLQGTVSNLSGQPVQELTLFASDGDTLRRADLAALLPAKGSLAVDVPLQSEPGTEPGGIKGVLRAVAVSALASGGQPVLTGVTAALPSEVKVDGQLPERFSGAILQQPLRLEGADGLLRHFEQRRLASSSGDPATGFEDVYDVSMPPVAGPLKLTYNSALTAELAVYDFARGDFVPVTPAPAGQVVTSAPLSPSQVSGGLVRVRLREDRLFRGAALWVEAAGD